MTPLSVTPAFISIGSNRTPSAAACSKVSGRIAFGAHNTVALWNLADEPCKGVEATLKGHVGVVNVVRWIPGPRGGESLASGGVDKCVRVWKETNGAFELTQTITDHTGSVNCIAVLPGILATGSSDGTVNIYSSNPSNHYSRVQSLRISPLFPLTLALHDTKDGIILAIGGSSPNIHIFVSPLTPISFVSAAVLKGHEDWIRGLDFTVIGNDLTLASASQDRYVRLWRISPSSATIINSNDLDALLTEALGGESYPFTINKQNYSITFSALLPGHDDWVFTVSFHPTNRNLLLSASADASLIIWRPEENSGIWIPETRLGEVSSLKGATTAQGSSGGFWGGVWSPDGNEVSSWGKTGAWRVWKDTGDFIWQQKCAISGAIRGVKGISWDPQGRYLLSTSLDQTTRMYGEWIRDGKRSWHEVARPQIHGYDLNAISSLNDWKFVSGADEKVLRVFQTSKTTAELVNRLAGRASDTENLPSTANLPVLGLSNKESSSTDEFSPTFLETLSTPPLEDHLSRYTLSPELEKLYAHPSEIIAVAASHNAHFIASTCKSSTPENAVIRIFSTASFSQIAVLPAHSLSVVKLAWSGDDSLLVSVGRDRQWSLFDTREWKLVKSMQKAHARIIWDVDFAPMEWGRGFVTASRDKGVKFWGGEAWDCVATVKFGQAVTACTFLQCVLGGMGYCAVGLENGGIYILGCEVGKTEWRVVQSLEEVITHAESVTSLAWRPRQKTGNWELASCGDDCSVRIFEVVFPGNQI